MHYRCPQCSKILNVPKLFFSDISACKSCGQKVMLGDFLAFFMAAVSMLVMALSALYLITLTVSDPIISGGYALSIGMVTGIVVLVLLGRAVRFKSMANKHAPSQKAPLDAEA
ncbi:hypothetical protein [Caenimonas koreensis]|uniref:hypothetical protein n=1 Tax=Caenimonas koreensis TaxID=367474 RepID=UPI0037841B2C